MSQNPGPGYGQTPPPGQPYGYPPQQAPNQQYGQPQQGPNPYGQANQPYGQPPQAPNQPYGQQPQPPANPYGQPQQGFVPAPATGAYGAAPTRPAKRSPILGFLGLAVVVICAIILSASLWRMGGMIGQLAVNGTIDTTDATAVQAAVLSELGGIWTLLVYGSGLLGFVGWILGIVATATNRGRALGVVTIILGVLAPFVAIGALVMAIAPYAS